MKIEPMVNAHLDRMNGLQRATVSLCHVILCIESWISPDGKARAWIKTNARLAVFIAAPTFMAFPVITMALWELEAWVNALTSIAGKLIVLPILILLAFVSVSIVLRIISAFKR